jgi:hypothetical protein
VREVTRRFDSEEFIALMTDGWDHLGCNIYGIVAVCSKAVYLLEAEVPPDVSHTAVVLSSAVQDVFEKFHIDRQKIQSWTTDSAAVEKATVSLMDIEHNACMAHIAATCGRLFGRQIKKVGGNPWKAIKKMQATRWNSSKYTCRLDSMLKSEIGQRMLRPNPRLTAWQPERNAIAVCTRWLAHFEVA